MRSCADIALVDLVERAEALLVEGAADHQPVGGIGICQHRLGDRLELADRGAICARAGAARRLPAATATTDEILSMRSPRCFLIGRDGRT